MCFEILKRMIITAINIETAQPVVDLSHTWEQVYVIKRTRFRRSLEIE